jgi:plasmid stabilization system protein ParE
MKYKVKFSEKARHDTESAYQWYNEQLKGLGKQFKIEYKKIIQRIIEKPFQFPEIYTNTHMAVIRKFPYTVFFEIEINTIIILAVFHAKQNPDKLSFSK